MKLRDYQEQSITMLYDWMEKNNGHPCLVLPTGAGKSVVIAELCRRSIKNWPDTRILMLVSSKELIAQNAAKMRSVWPNAPMGIYSASLRKRELGEPITFAGIGSVRNRAKQLGHIDLCVVDECDMISHKDEGGYRNLINNLLEINPAMRVIGFTASPFRMGHGLITDKPAIFDALIEPTSILDLINNGYLSPLRSKYTQIHLDVKGVHKRNGEYIESELQAAVDKDDVNQKIVDEVIALGQERKHWLFFCSGIDHANHIRDVLKSRQIAAESVSSLTPLAERDKILKDFASGKIRAVTNTNILSVGFDMPNLDLIAMLRPTMSPRLYLQIAGRGTRLKSHTDSCTFLDFAGVDETHGPITAVKPPSKGGDGNGEAPVKVCDNCNELVHISTPICPACGTEFPVVEKAPLKLHDVDIMGMATKEIWVTGWNWSKHYSRASKIEMIKVVYYGALSDLPVTEYLCVKHDGYAAIKAMQTLTIIAKNTGVILPKGGDIDEVCDIFNNAFPPEMVEYKMDGKYARVINRRFRYAPR